MTRLGPDSGRPVTRRVDPMPGSHSAGIGEPEIALRYLDVVDSRERARRLVADDPIPTVPWSVRAWWAVLDVDWLAWACVLVLAVLISVLVWADAR